MHTAERIPGLSQRFAIEQLAAATGLTVRNIREHQTRGLLPPPVIHGRKGAYDARHIARLKFIQQLQSEGLNLQAIHWLLQRAPAETTDEVVRFERALFAPWGNDEPARWTTDELRTKLGRVDGPALQRAIDLDVIRRGGPDLWEIPSVRLLHAGADLRELGVPLDAALNVVELLRGHTGAVARTFVKLFITHVWGPFEARGRPADEWETVRRALERLRPVATQALLAVFQQSMETTIDNATAETQVERHQEPA
jgi:DNA-binding transcriptional MerR regulator